MKPEPRTATQAPGVGWRARAWRAVLVVGLCTAISELLLPYLDRTSAVTVYLAGVVYVALRMGQAAATFAVVLSILAFDLLIVEPRWSFAPLDPQYYLTFLVMLVVGVLIGRLGAQASLQTALAEARARRAQALSDLTGRLIAARSPTDLADALEQAVQHSFGVDCALLLPDAQGQLQRQPAGRAALPAALMAQAQACFDQRDGAAGAALLLRLQGTRDALGVLALPAPGEAFAAPEDRQLLDAMADPLALALERTLF